MEETKESRKGLIPGIILALVLAVTAVGFLPGGTAETTQVSAAREMAPNAKDFVIEGDVLVKCNSKDADVKVPKGIVEIGSGAFRGLETLEIVRLPDSVEKTRP